MKNFLAIICLLLAACGGGRTKPVEVVETWPITPKNGLTEKLLELDSLSRAIMGDRNTAALELDIARQLDMPNVDAETLRQQRDSAEMVWHRFIGLCNEEKNSEALELYRANKPLFTIALEHSTARYYLHYFVAILAQEYLPEEEVRADLIDEFEMDLIVAESIMMFSNGETVPEHYEGMLDVMSKLYYDAEQWDKALEMNDKLLEFYKDDEFYLLKILTHRAEILDSMGDKTAELKLLKQMKADAEKGLKKVGDNEDAAMPWEYILMVIDSKIDKLK